MHTSDMIVTRIFLGIINIADAAMEEARTITGVIRREGRAECDPGDSRRAGRRAVAGGAGTTPGQLPPPSVEPPPNPLTLVTFPGS